MTQDLSPVAVRGLAAFESQPNLSWAVFSRSLAPAEKLGITTVVDDFYSKSLGGSARPMIYVEFTEDGLTAHFRAVTGREAPSQELFEQLLAQLSSSFGFDFSRVFKRDQLVSTARPAPPFRHPKYNLGMGHVHFSR